MDYNIIFILGLILSDSWSFLFSLNGGSLGSAVQVPPPLFLGAVGR